MNLYFLLEGKRTELQVYRSWLRFLLPRHTRVDRLDAITDHNYLLFSGEGYPSLLDNHLANAIADVNKSGRFEFLVVCLDADELSVAERADEVTGFLKREELRLRNGELRLIVQNRCIETWFLGNRKMLVRAPQSTRLADFVSHYNVRELDPEQMGVYRGFRSHAEFHTEYVREMFAERGLAYSKRKPGHVLDEPYLDQLTRRIADEPGHLRSFRDFVTFCHAVNASGQ